MTGKRLQKRQMIIFTCTIFTIIFSIAVLSKLLPPRQFFHGDYPHYPKVSDIVDAADVIIAGDVISAREVKHLMVDKTPNKADKETTPYTISTIKVTEVIKGNIKVGDLIEIKQLGDYKNKPELTLYEMNGYLEKDSKELMFLCEYANSPYSPVNPAQGVINIMPDGSLYSANKHSLWGYREAQKETDEIISVLSILKSYVDAEPETMPNS